MAIGRPGRRGVCRGSGAGRPRPWALGEALAQLSPELRAVLEATVLDGLTCAEAGVLLGIAEGTVKSRCSRARIALRAATRRAGALYYPTTSQTSLGESMTRSLL